MRTPPIAGPITVGTDSDLDRLERAEHRRLVRGLKRRAQRPCTRCGKAPRRSVRTTICPDCMYTVATEMAAERLSTEEPTA